MPLAHVQYGKMIIGGVVVDVKTVLQAIDLEILYETPKELLTNCPFCGDDSRNLSVNRESGLYHCWRCGAEDRRARGSLVYLVSILRGIDYVDATEYILRYGTFANRKELLRRLHKAFRRDRHHEHYESVAEDVNRYYNPRHPYWRRRGINRETATRFHLGYDQRRNHAIIPLFYGGIPIALIRRNDSGYGPKYYFPKGMNKERFLYGLDHCSGTGGLVIVEGPIDALKVHQAGYNAVAVMGDTFSTHQSQQILDYGPKYVALMTDDDLGGEILSTKVWEQYPLRNVYYTELPSNRKDPGECNADEIWEAMVTKRHILGLYLARLQERSSGHYAT